MEFVNEDQEEMDFFSDDQYCITYEELVELGMWDGPIKNGENINNQENNPSSTEEDLLEFGKQINYIDYISPIINPDQDTSQENNPLTEEELLGIGIWDNNGNLIEENNREDDQESINIIKNVPPGFRFRPRDEELIQDFLSNKILNMQLPPNIIQEVQLYNHHPRDICQPHELIREDEWYFFTRTQKKHANGVRPNRTTVGNGFWKTTSGDVKIKKGEGEIGRKRTLVYYEGKGKASDKTNWIMHEYRIDQTTSRSAIQSKKCNSRDTMGDYSWVLCRIHHRQTSNLKDDTEKI